MPWIGVDLDGTLARDDGSWMRGEIGPPVPAMVDRVRRHLMEGYDVRIFTARMAKGGITVRRRIREWTEEHIGVPLEATAIKDMDMVICYDDRARQVVTNTGVVVGEEE